MRYCAESSEFPTFAQPTCSVDFKQHSGAEHQYLRAVMCGRILNLISHLTVNNAAVGVHEIEWKAYVGSSAVVLLPGDLRRLYQIW